MPPLPAVSPEMQLVLCCARIDLDHAQTDRLQRLLARPLDWERLMALAARHGLFPLLYRHLVAQPSFPVAELVPEDAGRRLHLAYLQNVANTLVLSDELGNILAALDAADIPAIPYKGVALGEQLYGDPTLRVSGDIDVIVPRERVMAARDRLTARGYVPLHTLTPRQEKTYLAGIHHYNLIHREKAVSVEIHWDIVGPQYAMPVGWPGLWRRTGRVDLYLGAEEARAARVFASEDLLLLLLIHGSKHRWEALKWLVDVGLLIHRNPNLDWNVLMDRASQWRAERMALLGLYLAHELLDAPLPPWLWQRVNQDGSVRSLAAEATALCDQTMAEGLVSDYSRIVFVMRVRERWRDRFVYGWRLLTHLNFQDIDRDDRPEPFYYLRRPVRLIRKNGWAAMSRIVGQMVAALGR